jgi:hypothetical protein
MTNKRGRALAAALLPLALPLAFPGLAWAQAKPAAPDPLIQITPQQATSFAAAFTALSQQAHVCLVAEDQPLYPTFAAAPASSPARRAAASLALKKEGEPLSTLLPKLAAAYDYDVQPLGKAFLLKKRYTDPADLPSITLKECALGLEEASRYAENFNPHIPLEKIGGTSVISDLIYSLTPDQLQAMGDNKRGVPVASLSPVQQQEVQQFVMHLYVQKPLERLPSIVGMLNLLCAGDTQFGWRYFPQMNARLFGYDAPSGFGYKGFQILSKPNQVKMHLAGGIEIWRVPVEGEPPPTPATAMQLTSAPDPTDPAPMPANAPKPVPPVSASLADIVARLNARAADGLKVSVEPYLAPKQATVFGEEAVTPRQELDALADVYGLRVFTGDKEGGHDRLRLTRLTAQVPLNLIALHDSILQALPDPLVRAYRMHNQFAAPVPAAPDLLGVPPQVYAVRQIRAAVEPRVRALKDGKDGRVALSSLSEKEGRAFAMTLMVDAVDALGSWTEADVPDAIMRFNDLRLGGGLYEEDGKKKLTLTLKFQNPNNPTLMPGPGVGNLNYDPVNHTL